MTKYESFYIISTKLEDEAIAEKINKFKTLVEANGGANVEVITDSWGRRKLAYEIDDQAEGYYVLMNFESEGNLPKELERNFNIDENILRYTVLRKD